MSSMNDPNNIRGMLGIIVDDPDLNIEDLEKSIISGNHVKKPDNNNLVEECNDEIEEITRRFSGLPPSKSSKPAAKSFSKYDDDDLDIDNLVSSTNNKKMVLPSVEEPISQFEDEEEEQNEEQEEEYQPEHIAQSSLHQPILQTKDTFLNNMTNEQIKQQQINSVLSGMETNNKEDSTFLQQEDEEDELVRILEQIDLLKSNLEGEGIDLSRIPEITTTSTMKDAKKVLKILQIKNDRSRYCDMFEELILAGAYSLEGVFDGKKEWFGTKIDLVGWPETVKVKLRRMRYDTSSFVSEVMRGYSISHGWRIIFELLPSLFLYSRDRRKHNTDNLASDDKFKDAMQSLAS